MTTRHPGLRTVRTSEEASSAVMTYVRLTGEQVTHLQLVEPLTDRGRSSWIVIRIGPICIQIDDAAALDSCADVWRQAARARSQMTAAE